MTDQPDPAPETGAERVAVGRINAPWGVRGHVKVTALTSNPERLAVEVEHCIGLDAVCGVPSF